MMCGRWTDLDAPDFRSHAQTCADCAAWLRPESLEPSKATRDAIFDVIREEAARRRKRPTTRRIRVRRLTPATGGGGRIALAAAAAALFALVVGYALHRPAPLKPRETPVTRLPDPAPEPEPPPLPPIERPKDLVPPPPPVPKRTGTLVTPPTPPAPPAPAPAPPPRPTIVEAPAPAKEFARVVRVTGSADVKKGDAVLTGQAVTCRLGLVQLEIADETQIVLRAGASVSAESELAIRLHDGEVACSVRKGRTFAVETAHGSAAVRGTMFSVKTQASGATVVVSRGRVDVAGQMLEAGQRSRLVKGAASKPEAVAADRLLEWANLRAIGPIWIAAGAAELRAPMTRGRLDGALTAEPLFAAVDARTLKSWGGRFLAANGDEGGAATFAVDVPHDGDWRLWGRMFHPATGSQVFGPDNDPNSFFVSVDGGAEKVFGNHKGYYRRWHWAGDGTIERGEPAGLKLSLTKGRHLLRIRPRDAVETPSLKLSTRLDVLCLTPDPDDRPRDEDYRKP
ncbi:MAG TPA: FecR family protein [Planctomycetota bacterium]